MRAASTAPSGAHRQPWTFVAVSDPDIKRRIRIAAEREEHENYEGRMPDEWLRALEPLGTDEHKPFLEIPPRCLRGGRESQPDHLRRPPTARCALLGIVDRLIAGHRVAF